MSKAKDQLKEMLNNFDAMSTLLQYRAKCAKVHYDALITEGFNEKQAVEIVTNTKY
jgi:hypothetical protein